MTAYDDPLDGPRPVRGWVKIVGVLSVLVLVAAVLFGLSQIGVFSRGAAAPVRVVKPPADMSGFNLPLEVQPATFRPANPAPIKEAVSPVARPAARLSANGEKRMTPLDSPILALGGQVAASPVSAAAHHAAGSDGDAADDPLATSLRATKLEGTKAQDLGDQNFTIGQGRFITCNQITAFSSEHPGGVVATIRGEEKSDSGNVTLLDNGSTLFGTSQHAMVDGADTAFVLWQSVSTAQIYDRHGIPHRYRVTVNSGATNDDGETGMEGDKDRHLRTKIPALIGISLMNALPGAVSALASHGSSNGGTAVNFINAGGQGVQSAADAWLNRILSQHDTLRRLQGSRCGMLLMRDLDFSGVFRVVWR